MQKTRQSHADIIRVLALVLASCNHFIGNYGFPDAGVRDLLGFSEVLLFLISDCGVPLFLMLSGYLCSKRKANAEHYISYTRILVPYLLCAVVCHLYNWLFFKQEMSLEYIVGSVVNFYYGNTWYVCLYTSLFILMPFLNAMYFGLETKKQKQLLILCFFTISHLPSLLNSYVQLWSVFFPNFYPFVFYLIGVYASEYKPKFNLWKTGLLLSALLLAFGIYDVLLLGQDISSIVYVKYEHYQTFFLSTVLFFFLYSMPSVRPGAVLSFISRISSLSLSVYLMAFISESMIFSVFTQLVTTASEQYKWIVLIVPLSVLISAALAQLVEFISAPLEKALRSVLSKLITPPVR